MLILGESGSGKSYFLLNCLTRLVETLRSLVIVDMKNELAEMFCEQGLPTIASKLPSKDAQKLAARVVVVNPFSATQLPPLNVLIRDPSVAIEIQSLDIAECFEAATEADVSLRMGGILTWILRLVIGLDRGYSFETIRRALQEPLVLDGLVASSNDIEAKRYFLTRFVQEPKASKAALLARIDKFLSLPVTRLVLGADNCLNFDQLLDNRIVVVLLGGAPAGLQSIARFFAMIILTRIVRAIFKRPARVTGAPSIVLCDEWQLALNSSLAQEFEQILALTRSRRVFFWLANQQLAQLNQHGGSLRSIVLGQTSIQTIFRVPQEDARAVRHLLPVTGIVRASDAKQDTVLSRHEELEWRVDSISRLPNRTAYFCDKRAPWGTVLIRSADLTLSPVASLPRALVTQCTQGSVAFTPAALQAMRDREERALNALSQPIPAQRAHCAPRRAVVGVIPTAPQPAPKPAPVGRTPISATAAKPSPYRRGNRKGSKKSFPPIGGGQ
jgi:hypothetical protein